MCMLELGDQLRWISSFFCSIFFALKTLRVQISMSPPPCCTSITMADDILQQKWTSTVGHISWICLKGFDTINCITAWHSASESKKSSSKKRGGEPYLCLHLSACEKSRIWRDIIVMLINHSQKRSTVYLHRDTWECISRNSQSKWKLSLLYTWTVYYVKNLKWLNIVNIDYV